MRRRRVERCVAVRCVCRVRWTEIAWEVAVATRLSSCGCVCVSGGRLTTTLRPFNPFCLPPHVGAGAIRLRSPGPPSPSRPVRVSVATQSPPLHFLRPHLCRMPSAGPYWYIYHRRPSCIALFYVLLHLSTRHRFSTNVDLACNRANN